jgi:antitoxin (DNA-binding transcriptional repressor) of toxin-antitoxin stability system
VAGRSLVPGGSRRRKLADEAPFRPALRPGGAGRFAAREGALAYSGGVGEIPLEDVPREVTDAAHDAARGQVVYLTEHGERLAAIVPAELAAELENLTPEQFRELLEDFADAQAAREALAEVEAGAEPVPAEQVWAELGLGT